VGRQTRDEAWHLCEYYGEKIIPVLIDALIEETSQTTRRFFMGLLQMFGDRLIPETIRRLGDNRWFVKRNMLYLLGECGSKEVLPHVRPYCRHENRKVSFEAIKCLLNAGDRYGIQALEDYLRSDSRDVVDQAIALAGSFRIREVVPTLLQMLKKRVMSGADLYDKMPVVRALGEIGDPRAIDRLRVLLSGKSLLFKQTAEKLKEEIYRTLKYYPLADVKAIIEAGLKSRNEYIREESLRLNKDEAG
jgi:HEAT repeat protein